ncbi:ADP-ribosyltransferase [Mycolicibacterium conceptionense]|uniref:ADP-ribosyltransferase n=3 Tax=Mycolicibacterium conceptionense TaxID=451644 RepID=UPI0013F4C3AC|nr:ADP-ribosyltransferase [Mycolicibacterium conceptionense]
MTAPTSAPTSYEQALLVAEQLVAARAAGADPVSTAAAMSERIIATRENTAAWAKTAIRRLWATVDPYDPKQVEAFTIQAAQLMESAQTAVARMAAAGQAQQLAAMGIPVDAVPSNPVDVRGATAVVRKGMLIVERQSISVGYGEDSNVRLSKKDMTALGVLARPGMVYRFAKSQGASDEVAAALAAGRIDDLVDNNLMLAQRIAEQESIVQAVDLDTGKTRNGIIVIGYRRIIHPELSRTGTCGMCIAASDRIYTVGKLLPIHDKCKCTIAAVTEDYDPADDLNTVDLAQLYKDAGGTSVAHLKRTRYQVDQHGELGPTLVPKSKYKPRTTKSKVRAGGTALPDDQPAQAEVAKHQLHVMEENLARLRAEGEPEDSPKIAYHEKLIAKLQATLSDVNSGPPRQGPPNRTAQSGPARTAQSGPATQNRANTPPGPPRTPNNGGVAAAGDDDGDDPLKKFPYAVPASEQRSLDRLTEQERATIEAFAFNGYERINGALREFREMTPDIQRSIDRIRDGLRKYPLDRDVRVTREVSGAVFGVSGPGDESAVAELIGQVFDEPGFMSTTMAANPAHSERHKNPLTLDFLVPAGTPALAIGPLSDYPLEHEMLIIDARQYQIVGARYDREQNRWRLFALVDPEA